MRHVQTSMMIGMSLIWPQKHDERWLQVASEPEPRWHASVAVITVAVLRFALPTQLHLGPPWLVLTFVASMLSAIILLRRKRDEYRAGLVSITMMAIVTIFLIYSVTQMVWALLHKTVAPLPILFGAAALWASNIIVFASWYWRLDAGGPHFRDLRGYHVEGAFLFPQMTLDIGQQRTVGCTGWSPNFIDYLFLAFNTSTALSPADTGVLTRWAKLVMMLQSMISLTIIVLLAARAVNIL